MAQLLVRPQSEQFRAPGIDYRFRPFRRSRSKFYWWAIDLVPVFLYQGHKLSKSIDIIIFSHGSWS